MRTMSRLLLGVVASLLVTGCDGANFPPADMKDVPLSDPLTISPSGPILSVGDRFSIGIHKDGSVWSWGANRNGVLARNVSNAEQGYRPGVVDGLRDAISVSASSDFALAVTSSGSVWSWGGNRYGQLGYDLPVGADGKQTHSDFSPVPRMIPGLSRIKNAVAAMEIGVALAEDGSVWAWGSGGDWSPIAEDGGPRERRRPLRIAGMERIVSITASSSVIAGIDADGNLITAGTRLECGRRQSASIGPSSPVGRVPLPGRVVQASLSSVMAGIALLENGQVWVWGWNGSGRLGLGDVEYQYAPRRIDSLSGITKVAAGLDYMVALSRAGDLIYWGNLVYGSSLEAPASKKLRLDRPVVIARGVSCSSLVAGPVAFACIDESGAVKYMGWNRHGQRGVGRANQDLSLDYLMTFEKSLWNQQGK